jgi:hypothetical protein
MELALVLSSIAGAATAATISKFPKGKNKVPLIGANSHIRAQIDTLRIEKEILQKTISRLYGEPTTLTKIQVDKLLSKYQYQLGIILAKIEKLEAASKYPDLGPLGDGLMTLMDQKLSALDKRLADISSKIQVAQTVQLEKPEIKETKEIRTEKPAVQAKPEITTTTQDIEDLIKSFAKPGKRIEFTTLTEIPDTPVPPVEIETRIEQPVDTPEIHVQTMAEIIHAPEIIPVIETKQEIIQVTQTIQPEIIKPQVKPFITEPIDIEQKVKSEPPKLEFKESEKKKPKVNLPEPEEVEDDEDDLDSIKREIMKTLSKLEQAEVE